MDIERNTTVSRPRLVGRFTASEALPWMLVAPILGAAVARLAVWTQTVWSPLLIFPLLVGCGLGLGLAGVMRLGQVGHRTTIWSGVVLAAAVAVAGQHYFSFLDFKVGLAAQKSDAALDEFQQTMRDASTGFGWFMRRQAILGRPLAGENMLHGAAAWASWALDGLLTLLAAGTIIYLACRAPYCPLCRSWYRTIRAGPLTAGRAARLAHAASLGSEEPAGTGQYRLSHCVGGCGPGKLEMACSGWQKNRVAEAWLSAVQRAEVVRVLDEPRE